MRQSSRKIYLIGVILLICLAGIVSAWLDAPRRHGKAHIEVQAQVDLQNYMAALLTFSNVFGKLPTGDNATVTSALLGNNPRNHVFLHLPPQRTNSYGEFIDPTHKPYQINIGTNEIRITRLPK